MALACEGKWGSGMIPYLFAQAILAFTYYVYVFRYIWSLFKEYEIGLALIYLILFHLCFIMCQVSYFKCTFTDPGGIPEGFPETFENKIESVDGDVESATSTLIIETNKKGERRQCDKCSKVKPDRSHHCSSCKRCVLKMDHHCPWVNNCVGFYNYKYFLLFLTWIVMTCFIVVITYLPEIIQYFNKGKSLDIFEVSLFIIGVVFGIGLSLFAGTHYVYVFNNQTTIEVMEKNSNKKTNVYHLGTAHANFTQIFGKNPYLWFVPVFTSVGNGLWFPQNPSLDDQKSLIV